MFVKLEPPKWGTYTLARPPNPGQVRAALADIEKGHRPILSIGLSLSAFVLTSFSVHARNH